MSLNFVFDKNFNQFSQPIIKVFITIGLVICVLGDLQAGISNDLMAFFKRVGMASNVSSAGVYKDQSAGYYTGGSMMVRNSVRNAQLATVQMPGFRGGCGGIDMWTGGFSHINKEEIINMMRSIGSSAASYAFMLAVQTVSPQISNVMNELNAIATQINQTNINSCEAAATLLGGVWPKSDQSSKHLCQAMGSNLSEFSDWAAARQGCGAKNDRQRILDQEGSNSKYKDMLVGEFNLAWKAIQANAFLRSDPELAQLFLTLVGSIIVRKNGETFESVNLIGHADKDNFLSALLEGGTTGVYHCDEQGKCLNPILKDTLLSQESGLLRNTMKILESLINSIYDDKPATPEEIAFLNSTKLPVYKMLNVTTAFRKGYAPLDIYQYAELIALDILYKYVIEVIDIVHDSVLHLKSVQVDDAHMDRFMIQLRDARGAIVKKRQSAYAQMDTTLSMIQTTQVIEKQLHVMMSNTVDEYA